MASDMSDWTCLCRAVNSSTTGWCEACGVERAGRRLTSVPKVAEGFQLYRDPVYPAPPATPEEAKAAMANIRALLDRMGGEIPIGTCPRHPEGCGRSRPALRGPA